MPRMAALNPISAKRKLAEPFEIVIDTREQLPYDFASVKNAILPFTTRVETLVTGDYSAATFQHELCIERKSKEDAFKSFGKDRERFEKEIVRMAELKFAAVVIEAEWSEIFTAPPDYSQKMKPKSIIASTVAWSQRYGVHFFAVPGRSFAEQLTYRLIERWVRDRRGS
jgi:ERCC4-type nuclease